MNTFLELARDSVLAIVFHVAPRFANVLIFIIIGRLAGPDQAGVFSLATTYLLIATTFMRGLDDLLIRQVARAPDRATNFFGNFLLLRFFLSATLYAALIFIVQHMLNYAATTITPIVILTISVLPDSLAFVGQSILLGRGRFGAPAAIQAGTNLLKMVVGTFVLLRGGNLMDIAWLWLGGSLLGMIVLLFVTAKQVGWLRRTDWLDFGPLKAHWRAALSFSAITVLTALDSQTDTVLLSVYRREADVGWYNAATTITFSLLMLAQAYRFAVYPLMARYTQEAPEKLATLFQKSVHYMGVVVMPMVAGIIFLAPQIVELVFGIKFIPATPVLQILVVSLLFFFIGEPCNRLMLVRDRQRVIVGLLAISAPLNIVLNLFFIPQYGAVGSALARTISTGVFFTLNFSYILRNLIQSLSLKSLTRPVIGAAVMVVVLVVIRPANILVSILVGAVTYAIMLYAVNGILPDDIQPLKHALLRWVRQMLSGIKT